METKAITIRVSPEAASAYERAPAEQQRKRALARPGMTGPGAESDEVVAEIPAKYNTATTLTAEVAADKRQHDFPLTK